MRRIALVCLSLLLATGCSTAPTSASPNTSPSTSATNAQPTSAGPVIEGSTLNLRLGQSSTLADKSQLAYTQLMDDSRCPLTVQCVWEGNAEIALQWRPASGRSQELRLHTSPRGGPTSITVGEHTITLLALDRGIAPKASLRIDRAN